MGDLQCRVSCGSCQSEAKIPRYGLQRDVSRVSRDTAVPTSWGQVGPSSKGTRPRLDNRRLAVDSIHIGGRIVHRPNIACWCGKMWRSFLCASRSTIVNVEWRWLRYQGRKVLGAILWFCRVQVRCSRRHQKYILDCDWTRCGAEGWPESQQPVRSSVCLSLKSFLGDPRVGKLHVRLYCSTLQPFPSLDLELKLQYVFSFFHLHSPPPT